MLPGDSPHPHPPCRGRRSRVQGGSRWRELVQSCGTRVEAGVVGEASWKRTLPGDSPILTRSRRGRGSPVQGGSRWRELVQSCGTRVEAGAVGCGARRKRVLPGDSPHPHPPPLGAGITSAGWLPLARAGAGGEVCRMCTLPGDRPHTYPHRRGRG
jgi:hypothetical protein